MHFRTNNACKRTTKAISCIIQIYLKVNLHHIQDLTLVSVGDTSGLRILCPSRCTEAQIYLRNTSGWANIGYFRCIAYNCQNKIHRNSTISSNPDVSQLISREYTYSPSQSIPARAGKNKQNTSEFNNFFQSRCISINFPRCYLYSLAVYPRASRQKQTKYIGIQQFIPIPMYSN